VNLLEACRRHNPQARLLYTSTRQVYGRPQRLPVTEDHPTAPTDVNAINKLAAEHYHLLYHRAYGVRSTVLRLTNTFGPRQQIQSNRQGFVTIFLRRALRGETIQLFDGGGQIRDFNYVDDVVNAMLLAATTEACFGKIFNLGSSRAYSLAEFVEILKRYCAFKVESVPFPEDRRIIDIGDYVADFSSFSRATAWQPQVELPQGLEKTVAFYRQHKEVYWP
jgi:nucleoside-diphosphate-sugar epimerase